MEADDPRWAESLHIPNLHDHLQAAKNGTEFSDVVMDSASQKTFTRLYRRVHYRWLLLKTNFHIHLHPMKKISYFAIVLLILFFLYALISTILTRHPATPNHQAIALHPATEGERHALMKGKRSPNPILPLNL